jgi:hypothetical protein
MSKRLQLFCNLCGQCTYNLEIVLGIFVWQKSYEIIHKVHPYITRKKYNDYRKQYGLE